MSPRGVNRKLKINLENLEILLYSKTGSQRDEDHFELVVEESESRSQDGLYFKINLYQR
jgi:hypothetical protein